MSRSTTGTSPGWSSSASSRPCAARPVPAIDARSMRAASFSTNGLPSSTCSTRYNAPRRPRPAGPGPRTGRPGSPAPGRTGRRRAAPALVGVAIVAAPGPGEDVVDQRGSRGERSRQAAGDVAATPPRPSSSSRMSSSRRSSLGIAASPPAAPSVSSIRGRRPWRHSASNQSQAASIRRAPGRGFDPATSSVRRDSSRLVPHQGHPDQLELAAHGAMAKPSRRAISCRV